MLAYSQGYETNLFKSNFDFLNVKDKLSGILHIYCCKQHFSQKLILKKIHSVMKYFDFKSTKSLAKIMNKNIAYKSALSFKPPMLCNCTCMNDATKL